MYTSVESTLVVVLQGLELPHDVQRTLLGQVIEGHLLPKAGCLAVPLPRVLVGHVLMIPAIECPLEEVSVVDLPEYFYLPISNGVYLGGV